jgi:hypothetical protein
MKTTNKIINNDKYEEMYESVDNNLESTIECFLMEDRS